MMKVAVYGRLFSENYASYVQQLFDTLAALGVECMIYEPFYDYLNPRVQVKGTAETFTRHKEIRGKVKFLFSIGGDGTFLDSTTFVKDDDIAIIGVNTGRLGFLSAISIHEVEDTVKQMVNGNYNVEERTLLKVETKDGLFGDDNFALNELTIHKKDTSSMIVIQTYLGDEFLNSYWADGLIVATPTGSTAYSLSCGGPIILPGSDNFVITPIAPHNLNVRPIVIPDDKKVTLKVEGRSQHYLVSLDSRSETIDASTELIVSKNNFKTKLVRLKEQNQLNTIRNKLNWGLDKRN